MTLGQIGLCVLGAILGFAAGTNMPGDWKVGNLPAGFLVGLSIFCLAIVAGRMTEIHPMVWWKNRIFYLVGIYPRMFIPRPNEMVHPYPDPTIVEIGPAEEEFYIEK